MGRAAAATGAIVGGPLLAPRVVFAGNSGETVFELPARGGVTETKRGFELLGLEGAQPGTKVRARGLDGRWGPWFDVAHVEDHGPDPAAGGASGAAPGGLSDPVWTGPADAFELRAKRPLRGSRVVLVDSGAPAVAAAATRFVETGLNAGPGQPRIIARSSWATAACKPRVPAVFGAVDLAFVHHTVNSNRYHRSQSAGMVRSICLFHKYGNRWNDIGYNFVVDRYGQIFEARAGGAGEAIVGAQAGGYNLHSTGVGLLGNFTSTGPGRATFNALAELLAWKLSLHGLELPGTTTVTVSRQGAPYSRYRAGARVRLNRIAGHRDADTTSCPGSAMYRQLPRLRQVTARLAGTPSRLAAQPQAVTPDGVTLVGTLTAGGTAIGGALVEVEHRSTTRGPTVVASATTNPDGTWSTTAPLAEANDVRAVFRGGGGFSAVVSPGVSLTVPPQITLGAVTQQAAPGSVIAFNGSVAPPKAQVTLVITQQQPDGSFATIRSIRVNTASDGSFTRSIGFADPGQYQVIAHTAADAQNALGTSPPVAIAIG